MKAITGYIKTWFYEVDKRVLSAISLLTALLIWVNYYFKIDEQIADRGSFTFSLLARTGIFIVAFGLPYLFVYLLLAKKQLRSASFLLLLLVAPLIFSLKIAANPRFRFSDNWTTSNFWNHVLYWPILLILVAGILVVIWKLFHQGQPFYGIKTKGVNWSPYFIMLLIMVPLIAVASTQPDFQDMYPKLKLIADQSSFDRISWWEKILFELSYGSDFITIELFFRGFLVLGFIKWAGKDAILPMACFYCTIHFGKPLGECISSFFGGTLLGIIVFHTRSIFGGLLVHVGIAWLMEIGGYLGNHFMGD